MTPPSPQTDSSPPSEREATPDPAREDLVAAARAWIDGDPDPETRTELAALVDSGDTDELAERVAGRLEFGTAGLRGVVGAGPRRMNRAVVIQTSRGLADHLRAEGLGDRPVAVGFDARTDSPRFARDVVATLAAAGFQVHVVDEPAPTPLIAFAVQDLDAAGGVVVTASHNPPEYNGYKVYADDGAQIVPPTDQRIADAIDAVGPAVAVPRAEAGFAAEGVVLEDDALVERYLDALDAARPRPGDRAPLRIVYTPLHGVGWSILRRAFERAGHTDVHPVAEQVQPDGRFPTVRFPNPEEPGALDLAGTTADDVDADVVLANDPDADRLAVSVRGRDGAWQPLTGNQIGVLLAEYLLARSQVGGEPLVINSIVSSPMLGDVAAAHGARHEVTLTGFKWICNAALDLERDAGAEFVFGYEEALGYSVGRVVRDKDGIGAAVAFADLAANAKAEGASVLDRLGDLYRRHGLWVSVQHSVTRPGLEGQREIAEAMERIGDAVPDVLAGRQVTGATDYRDGADERPRWLPAADLVALDVEGGRVLVRPSGTEPKLKIYADLRVDLGDGDDWQEGEATLRGEALAVAEDLASFLRLT